MTNADRFEPSFDLVEKYVRSFLRTNMWRVKHIMDEDDAMQEARLTYFRLITRFEKRGIWFDGPGHFFSLFRTMWTRWFHTLSNRDTKWQVEVNTTTLGIQIAGASGGGGMEEEFSMDSFIGSTENEGYTAVLMDEAPEEVRRVMALLMKAPQGVLDGAVAAWQAKGRREAAAGNVFLCELLGYDPKKVDLVARTKRYFEV